MRALANTNTVNFIGTLQKLASFILERPIDVRASASGSSTDLKKTISVLVASDLTEEEKTKALVRLLHEIGHHEEQTIPFDISNPNLLNRMINMVDDIRIEKRQERKYLGLHELRKWYHPVVYTQFNMDAIATATQANLPEFIHKLSCVLLHTVRFRQLGIDIKVKMSPEIKAAYDKYLRNLETKADKQDDPTDSVKLGTLIYKRLKKLVEDQEKSKEKSKGKSEPEDSDEKDSDDSAPDTKDDKDSEKEDSESEESGESGDESDASEESVDTGESKPTTGAPKSEESKDDDEAELSDEAKKRIEKTLNDLENADMETPEERIDRELAEKASDDKLYMVAPRVVDIIEYNQELPLSAASTLDAGKNLLGAAGTAMTKLFVSNTKPRALHNQYMGRFDARAFIADPMDVRKDVYTSSTPGRLDKAAVSFVMDNSGSMSGTSIVVCYQVLSAMLYYLSKAGIPTEAVGFTADTCRNPMCRDVPVTLSIIKKYTDAYDGHVQARCVHPLEMEQNAEVDALRWAVPRLLGRPEPKKVIMLLGDGEPCIGNASLNYKLSKAYKKYIADCKALGIHCIGFGLGCDLRQFYGDDYISCDTTNVGQKMLEKLTEVLNKRRG